METNLASPSKSNNSEIEIRCNNDHALLFVAVGIKEGQIETVCRKCKKKSLIKFPILKKAS